MHISPTAITSDVKFRNTNGSFISDREVKRLLSNSFVHCTLRNDSESSHEQMATKDNGKDNDEDPVDDYCNVHKTQRSSWGARGVSCQHECRPTVELIDYKVDSVLQFHGQLPFMTILYKYVLEVDMHRLIDSTSTFSLPGPICTNIEIQHLGHSNHTQVDSAPNSAEESFSVRIAERKCAKCAKLSARKLVRYSDDSNIIVNGRMMANYRLEYIIPLESSMSLSPLDSSVVTNTHLLISHLKKSNLESRKLGLLPSMLMSTPNVHSSTHFAHPYANSMLVVVPTSSTEQSPVVRIQLTTSFAQSISTEGHALFCPVLMEPLCKLSFMDFSPTSPRATITSNAKASNPTAEVKLHVHTKEVGIPIRDIISIHNTAQTTHQGLHTPSYATQIKTLVESNSVREYAPAMFLIEPSDLSYHWPELSAFVVESSATEHIIPWHESLLENLVINKPDLNLHGVGSDFRVLEVPKSLEHIVGAQKTTHRFENAYESLVTSLFAHPVLTPINITSQTTPLHLNIDSNRQSSANQLTESSSFTTPASSNDFRTSVSPLTSQPAVTSVPASATSSEVDLIAVNPLPVLPRHIAVVMDGNGRWAERRGLSRSQGHREGVETIRRLIRLCRRYRIPYLTLYAFSAQNWDRPAEEVQTLMGLLAKFVSNELQELVENGVRLLVNGDVDRIPEPARSGLYNMIETSSKNDSLTLTLALSYGGREEIVKAVNKALVDARASPQSMKPLTTESFFSYFPLPMVPDPDLLIRTSGEFRVSNFLLWQIAYTEIYVTETLWPDFREAEMIAALKSYAKRERRFGKTGAQVRSEVSDGSESNTADMSVMDAKNLDCAGFLRQKNVTMGIQQPVKSAPPTLTSDVGGPTSNSTKAPFHTDSLNDTAYRQETSSTMAAIQTPVEANWIATPLKKSKKGNATLNICNMWHNLNMYTIRYLPLPIVILLQRLSLLFFGPSVSSPEKSFQLDNTKSRVKDHGMHIVRNQLSDQEKQHLISSEFGSGTTNSMQSSIFSVVHSPMLPALFCVAVIVFVTTFSVMLLVLPISFKFALTMMQLPNPYNAIPPLVQPYPSRPPVEYYSTHTYAAYPQPLVSAFPSNYPSTTAKVEEYRQTSGWSGNVEIMPRSDYSSIEHGSTQAVYVHESDTEEDFL